MARLKKNPSEAGVSAASVKGNAGPHNIRHQKNKVNSQNNQFKKD
ncbi:YuzL family protein [Bacillus sp. FJAT-27445]|nr:YuzL family protein [Bacillus sp. FJAT-27445]